VESAHRFIVRSLLCGKRDNAERLPGQIIIKKVIQGRNLILMRTNLRGLELVGLIEGIVKVLFPAEAVVG
jgi:hypothetical protein